MLYKKWKNIVTQKYVPRKLIQLQIVHRHYFVKAGSPFLPRKQHVIPSVHVPTREGIRLHCALHTDQDILAPLLYRHCCPSEMINTVSGLIKNSTFVSPKLRIPEKQNFELHLFMYLCTFLTLATLKKNSHPHQEQNQEPFRPHYLSGIMDHWYI